MRKIKFRGKRVDNGEWVYGDLVRLPKDIGGYNEPPSLELETFITDANTLAKDLVKVLHETVGQFIGLKDKNRKEIYKGDVINVLGRTLIIEWDNKSARFNFKPACYPFGLEILKSYELIGNIHEHKNPDKAVSDDEYR